MALTSTDFSVAANGDVRETAGTTTHPVIDIHRFLMGLLDDASPTADDLLAVDNAIIPSVRRTDQIIELQTPYNIDDTVSERFYGGSISQLDGDDLYSGLEVVGTVNTTTTLLLIQDANNDGSPTVKTNFWGDTTSSLYADTANNVLLRCLIKSRSAGVDLNGKRLLITARELGDTFAEFPVTLGTAVTTGAISTLNDTFNNTAAGTIAGWTSITNVTSGFNQIDINGDATTEDYFSEINIGTQTEAETYERGKWQQRRGTSESLYGLNGDLFRGITHEIDVDGGAGTWGTPEHEKITWTGGSGQLLAVDNKTGTSTAKLWFQLLTGVPPTDDQTITGGTSSATAVAELTGGSLQSRTINANCWMGNYTGAWLGAYGVGFEDTDVVAADAFTALDATTRNPPNNVSLEATGLVSGDVIFGAKTKTDSDTVSGVHSIGDTTLTLTTGIDVTYDTVGRIVIDGIEHVFTGYTGASVTIGGSGLKAALTGGEATSVTQFYNDEFTTSVESGTYNGTGDSVIQFTTSIGSGYPSAGKVRLWDGVDRYDEYSYTGITGQQLTGVTPTLTQNYSTQPGYIPYVSEAATGGSISKTVVHSGDVSGRWRLYNAAGNIVPFEVGFTITSGGSVTQLIRNSDA